MAITNAQQYQQLVNPPMKGKRRPGYRGDAAAAAGAPGMAGPGPGADVGDGPASTGDGGDRREQRAVATTLGISPITQSALDIERPDRNLGQREFDRRQRVRAIERFINRPTFGFTDAARFNLTPSPIRLLQGLGGLFTGISKSPVTTVGGGGEDAGQDIPYWAQLGFSSEEEYLASLRAQAPSTEEQETEEEPFQLSRRFRADGGRIGLQEGGGIEQRLEQLGGDVTSAEHMLQGINQRLKTAESSLGSGGGLGGLQQPQPGIIPVQQPLGQPQPAGLGIFESRPIQLPNIQPGADSFQPLGRPTTSGFETSFGFMDFDPNRERQYFYNKDLNRLFNLGMGTKMAAPKGFESVSKEQYEDFASKGATLQKASPFVDSRGGGYNLDIPRDEFGVIDRTSPDYLYFFGDQQKKSMLPTFGTGGQGVVGAGGRLGIPAAGYADGGNVVGGELDFESARQMYGLGKLVKKVTRTVKKIAKSPVGKAAILAATYKLGGGKFFGGEGFKFSNLPGLGFLKPASTSIGAQAAAVGLSPREFMMGIGGKTATSGGIFSSIPGGALTAGIVGASALAGLLTPEEETEAEELSRGEGIDIEAARNAILAARQDDFRARRFRAEGGSMKEPVAKKTMPLLDLDGKEMDLRAEGGFVPIGRMEKADDVPARLSKNEFVFTADAVRNAGDGNVDKGAEVMYNMMKNLEAGGEVSKESQGLEGARRMFQTSKRLEEVL